MPITDRLLLGPGPSNPYPEAVAAFGRPLLGHMDPEFLAIMDETMARLRTVFRTENALTLPMSGTGSAGMEACFVNLLEPGDTAIVGANGVFGDRMCEVARRCGAEVVRIEAEWGSHSIHSACSTRTASTPTPASSRSCTRRRRPASRTTSRRSRALHDTDTLLLVDTVTSLGGIPVEIDGWGVDAGYSGTQKCLGVPPGLSPVTFSPRAVERVQTRATPPQSWYLDLVADRELRRRRQPRVPPHRTGLDGVRAARRARRRARRGPRGGVGAPPRRRHPPPGRAARARLPPRRAPRGTACPQLTTAWLPDGADDAALRKALLGTYGIEVGGGLGEFAGQAWRIGLMGHSARERSVTTLLGALRELLG